MSALSLYAEVCRSLLEFNPLDDIDSQAWHETVRKLRRLRHVLQCRICKVMRREPYGASGCNHITCRGCKDSKKGYFSGCRHCKNPTELMLDKQTIAVLKCYAKICEILESYRLTGANSLRNERIDKVWELVCEGLCLFETKDEETNRTKPEMMSLGDGDSQHCPSSRPDRQGPVSDVDKVPNENKVLQDGGCIKDGGHVRHGSSKEDNEKDNSGEIEEKKEKGNNLQDKKINLSNSSADPSTDSCKHNSHSNKETNEKLVPKLFAMKEKDSNDFKLVSNFPCNRAKNEPANVHQKQIENGEIVLEAKNGFLCSKNFDKMDQNGRSLSKVCKSKLSPLTSTDSERKLSVLKKGKNRRTDNSAELQNQKHNVAKEEECQDANGILHLKKVRNSENSYVTNPEEVHVKEDEDLPSKKGKFENGKRQYGFLRKNKYKCSCGSATGMKHFADICNHKRCVCFAAGVPCVSCKCKFCSNPHKSHYNVKWSSIGVDSGLEAVKVEQGKDGGS